MTLSVCMIMRDEEAAIANALRGVVGIADEVICIDTGSKDATKEVAKSLGAEVYDFEWIKDFSAARNFSFSKASSKFILWIDSDDLVDPSELLSAKNKLETLPEEINAVFLPYNYAQDQFGNSLCVLKRERFIRRSATIWDGGTGSWIGAVHEVMRIPNLNCVTWDSPVVLHNRKEKENSFDRNIEILLSEYEKYGDSDLRVILHLGSEYQRVGNYDLAIKHLMKFVEKTPFHQEKCWATKKASECFMAQGNFLEAFDLALQCHTVMPSFPDGDFLAAQALMHQNQCDLAIRHLEEGFKKPLPETHLFLNLMDYSLTPYGIGLNSYLNQGNQEKALEMCNKALAINPEIEVFQNAKKDIEKELTIRKQEESLGVIFNELAEKKEIDKVEGLVASLPDYLQGRTPIIRIKKSLQDDLCLDDGRKVVVVSVRMNFETWNPDSPNKVGIGGSETSVIRMTEELSKLGYRCIVLNNQSSFEGVHKSGVEYWRHEVLDASEPIDTFIGFRYSECFGYQINAKNRFIWLQDVHCGNLTPEQNKNITGYLTLTEWHRRNILRLYPFIEKEKVKLIFNAVDMEPFKVKNIKRDPFRAIYASSPDRGLEYLIEMWPEIVEKEPRANLHIFYGWNNIDKIIDGRPDLQELKNKVMKAVQKGPNVTWHGRVGQKELAREFLKAGVMLTPSAFLETGYIAASSAGAAKTIVVTTPIAAAKEVVPGSIWINGHAGSKSYQKVYIEKAIDAMKNPEKYTEGVEINYKESCKRTWKNAAKQWHEEILNVGK